MEKYLFNCIFSLQNLILLIFFILAYLLCLISVDDVSVLKFWITFNIADLDLIFRNPLTSDFSGKPTYIDFDFKIVAILTFLTLCKGVQPFQRHIIIKLFFVQRSGS